MPFSTINCNVFTHKVVHDVGQLYNSCTMQLPCNLLTKLNTFDNDRIDDVYIHPYKIILQLTCTYYRNQIILASSKNNVNVIGEDNKKEMNTNDKN
jgi:hypothetical protein